MAYRPRSDPPDTVLGAGGKPSAVVWWDEHADFMTAIDPKFTLADIKAKREILALADKPEYQVSQEARHILGQVIDILDKPYEEKWYNENSRWAKAYHSAIED